MKKIEITLFLIDGLLAAAVIGIALYLWSYTVLNNARYEGFGDKQAAKTAADLSVPQSTAADAPLILAEDRTVELTLTDGAASPNSIPAYNGKQLTIKVTNNAKNTLTMKIDKLDMTSGPIKAGETKEITIKNLSDQAGSYEYQVISDDGTVSAKGNIIVM